MDQYSIFEEEWVKIQAQKEIEARVKMAQLDKEAKLIPLKQELIAHIQSIIAWLDLSNEWFLKSRDSKINNEEQKLNKLIYEFYKSRADLILEQLTDFLPKEALNG